jgi:hypothetical protein
LVAQQRYHPAEIHVGELRELGIRQLLLRTEETPVHRFSVKVTEGLIESVGVLAAYGSDGEQGAVLQCLAGT